MNITELARRLKITSNQLYDLFPQIGVDIGRRAIKIDEGLAHKIQKNWSEYQKLLFKKAVETVAATEIAPEEKRTVIIPPVITIRDFAALLNLPITKLMQTLMNNGILTALNEKIDYETASITAQDLGFITVQKEEREDEEQQTVEDVVKGIIGQEDEKSLKERPPVVVVMGHVDHGKTSLLDAIRTTNVIATESGGITQHIGAYQVTRTMKKTGEDKTITFIDTPGHEAFTTMRSRGAKIADIAILVVAADDGIKPQTVEAIKIIKAAAIPLIVAINKIDKPGADVERVKRELSDQGLIPEDWGGTTVCIPISAKKLTGIDDLLEMILLIADMEKDKMRANPKGVTVATVIESHIDKNEGPVATVLVQNGTLSQNDFLVMDNTLYGKVRTMRDYRASVVARAIPSQPVKIIGFKHAPVVGDTLTATNTLNPSVKKLDRQRGAASGSVVITTKMSEKESKIPSVNIILKTDTLGSLEAIAASLQKIEHPDVKVKIIIKELGGITTADVLSAEATHSFIAGFHVTAPQQVRDVASEKKVEIILYKIIYELIDDVKTRVEALLAPTIAQSLLGLAKVLKIFRSDAVGTILGCVVTQGSITPGVRVHILRNGTSIGSGKITSVQSGKIEIPAAQSGTECGLMFDGKIPVLEGDVVEAYSEEKVKRTLE